MNLRRFSFLVTTTLCAFTFLFAPASVSAAPKKEKVVASLKTEAGITIKVNGKTSGNGAALRCGDVLETANESVNVVLGSGPEYVIDPGTKVRLTCSPSGRVGFLVSYGGIHPVDGVEPYTPLPWIPAFANANSSFPSTGGGGAATNTGKIPVVNANGVVIGYALTNSSGQVVGYTDVTGRLLASFPPNSQPLSPIFPPGAVIL